MRGARVVFVDLLRLFATFQMVQGHTLDAVMAEAHRSGVAFEAWSWTRGLTSVAFLFAAGVSFHLATLLRFEEHRASPRAVRRRFERGLLLIVIGYLMHAPLAAIGGDAAVAAAALREALIVDVLQCIGVTLIVLEALTVLARSRAQVVAASAALAVLAIGAAPLAAHVEPSGAGAALLQYVTPRGGSIFPLLPWAGYMLAGVACAAAAAPEGGRTPRTRAAGRLLAGGGLLMTLALLAGPFAGPWAGSCAGLVKLGAVASLSGLFALASRRVARLPRPLEILAGETLIIYVTHVVLLYAAGLGLSSVVGRTLPLPQAILLAAALILGSAILGLGWHRLGAWRRLRPVAGGLQKG